MKRRKETIIKLVVKLAYPEEKCFTSIQISRQEMVRSRLRHSLQKFYLISVKFILFLIVAGIDEGDEAISSYAREEDDFEDVEYRELDTERLAFEVSETDTKGITVAAVDRLKANEVDDKNSEDTTGNN